LEDVVSTSTKRSCRTVSGEDIGVVVADQAAASATGKVLDSG
jgi:hypothetical protein